MVMVDPTTYERKLVKLQNNKIKKHAKSNRGLSVRHDQDRLRNLFVKISAIPGNFTAGRKVIVTGRLARLNDVVGREAGRLGKGGKDEFKHAKKSVNTKCYYKVS